MFRDQVLASGPDMKTRPLDATCIRGYNGNAAPFGSPARLDHWPLLQTCGTGLVGPDVVLPETTRTEPSGRLVAVGYHLPSFMRSIAVQVLLAGSYTAAWLTP